MQALCGGKPAVSLLSQLQESGSNHNKPLFYATIMTWEQQCTKVVLLGSGGNTPGDLLHAVINLGCYKLSGKRV